MEHIVGNAGTVRSTTWKGREFMVAPVTSIVPGVLPGSRGALYYPPSEVSRNVDAWDGVPITVYHPVEVDGTHVSAATPGIWKRQGVGRIRGTTFNGRLRHEAWIDVAKANAIDRRIVEALKAGRPMEVSTGLYTNNVPAKGSHAGQTYEYEARDYRPDHLALLPDQVGACSLRDGCGLGVNEAVSEAQRRKLNAMFGHEWVKEHGFDNRGSLPEYKVDNANFLGRFFRSLFARNAKRDEGGKFAGDEDDLEAEAAKRGVTVEELKKQLATNAKKDKCPECGGDVDEDGECEECGYVENALQSDGRQNAKVARVPPVDLDGDDDSPGDADDSTTRQDDQARKTAPGVRERKKKAMASTYNWRKLLCNDSQPGHLASAPRAQVQAAMASMKEEGGGGGGTGKANAATKKANESGKAGDHKAAASAHASAAKEHKEAHANGEGKHHADFAKAHSNMARSHSAKANAAAKTDNAYQRLLANCQCDEDRVALNLLYNDKAEGSNADATGGGDVVVGGYDDDDEDDDFPEVKVKSKSKRTMNQWLDDAPDEIRSVVDNALKAEKRERARLIGALVGNDQDGRLTSILAKHATEDLRLLAANRGGAEDAASNYLGAGGGPVENYDYDGGDGAPILELPTCNYAEWRKQG